MRHLSLIFLGCILIFSACKKNKETEQTTPAADSAYFFQFNFGGTDYHLKSALPENVLHYPHEIKGAQVHGNTEVPVIVLTAGWPNTYLVSDADILAMEGKQLGLGGSLKLSFMKEENGVIWHSLNGSVFITDVAFIKGQTITGELVLVYALRGTCQATMSDGTNNVSITKGSFNLPMSVLAR